MSHKKWNKDTQKLFSKESVWDDFQKMSPNAWNSVRTGFSKQSVLDVRPILDRRRVLSHEVSGKTQAMDTAQAARGQEK